MIPFGSSPLPPHRAVRSFGFPLTQYSCFAAKVPDTPVMVLELKTW